MAKLGRPSDYKPEYDEQVRKICALGANDKKLADFFNVSESTLNLWKLKHPTFSESLRLGKSEHDIRRVEASLLNRALGYTVTETTEEVGENANGPSSKTITRERHIPADTSSIIFYLRNRMGKAWSNNPVIDDDGTRESQSFTFNVSVKDPLNQESD